MPSPVTAPRLAALQNAVSDISDRRPESVARHGRLGFGIAPIDAALGGGLAVGTLHEIRCALARDIGAATGFLLALLARLPARADGRIVWIDDPASSMDGGCLFPAGLGQFGLDPGRLVTVRPADLRGALWAAGEAAACGGLDAVVLHLKGNPQGFDLTATRRLMLRARQSGVLAWVLRQSGQEEASAAETRWQVLPAPSPGIEQGMGPVRLDLVLERNRHGSTGRWSIAWNHRERLFQHVAEDPLSRTAAPAHRPGGAPEMGQVVALERAS